MDEAGRGALAGPVSVGLAVFTPAFFDSEELLDLTGLDDSKRLLPAARERLLPVICRHALFASCVMVSSRWIDRMGINPATEQAMVFLTRRFQRYLQFHSSHRSAFFSERIPEPILGGAAPRFQLLLDGNYRFERLQREPGVAACQSIVRGDSRVLSIAAASILAKVLRDRRMSRYHRMFPGYGLDVHKGYGTEAHRRQIQLLGLSPIHRKSYGGQLSLFSESP